MSGAGEVFFFYEADAVAGSGGRCWCSAEDATLRKQLKSSTSGIDNAINTAIRAFPNDRNVAQFGKLALTRLEGSGSRSSFFGGKN